MKNAFVWRIFLYVLLFFLLSACSRKIFHKKNRQQLSQVVIKKKIDTQNLKQSLNIYELDIVGIECKQCIRNILQKLHDSNLLRYAECRCPKDDYVNAKIICYIEKKQKSLPIQSIKKIIENDDFVLKSITGDFVGVITQENNKLFFTASEYQVPLTLIFDRTDLALASTIKPMNNANLYGVLALDKKQITVLQKRD